MPTVITSRQHPLCKLVRALHDVKGRRKHRLFAVEGSHAVAAALRQRWPIERLLLAPEHIDAEWMAIADRSGIELQPIDADLLEYLSDTQTAPGLIALARLPASTGADWNTSGLVLVLDGVGDPGNAGTLIRAADAAGTGGVVLTANSADAYNPKVVRATAGSLFNLPPLQIEHDDPQSIAAQLQEHNLPIIAAVAHDGENCFSYRWPQRCALVLGHETRGISPALESAATARVTIPMYGRAESLNVATAGAVLLYAWRQALT